MELIYGSVKMNDHDSGGKDRGRCSKREPIAIVDSPQRTAVMGPPPKSHVRRSDADVIRPISSRVGMVDGCDMLV